MAGSFSGHLVDSFLSAQQQSRGPFRQHASASPEIATYGAMSFAPSMHGTFNQAVPSPMSHMDPILMDLTEETARKIAALQAKLNKKLGPEYISQRPGPGGGPKLTYAEGWKIINLANEVFGFNGWSSSVVNLSTDFIDYNEESRRFTVGVTAIVRVMLRDGVFHEDIGYGALENAKSKGAALDKCKKEAVTDGVKRALRNFGNLLGNCLYDKHYAQEVIKIKVPPPKFDRSELHRRPEFEENRNNAGTSAQSVPPATATVSSSTAHVTTSMNPPPPPPHARASSGPGPAPNSNSASNVKPPMGLPNQPAPPRSTSTTTSSAGPSKPIANASAPAPIQNQPRAAAPLSAIGHRQTDLCPPGPQPSTSENASAADRRVTFAQQPTLASAPEHVAPLVADLDPDLPEDESFGLNSEDDEFFASVDLGEDLGGPIIFDEGADSVQSSNDEGPSVLGGHQPYKAQVAAARVGQSNRPPHAQYTNAADSSARPPLAQQSNSSSGYGKPSSQAGGFHFPSNTNAKPGSVVGMKRPADAMRDSTRRPVQGMGLSHVAGNSGRREPLGVLEMGGGGDVKRVKR